MSAPSPSPRSSALASIHAPGPLLAPGLALLIALAACSREPPPPAPATPAPAAAAAPAPREVRIVLHEPSTLDWRQGLDTEGTLVALSLHEGLFRWRPDGSGVEPGLATSHELSPDGLTWTFHLRPDATWSDGAPLTSADLLESWRACAAPDARCGAPEDVAAWLRAPDGLSAPDATTLVVRLPTPWPLLPSVLATAPFLPLPRHAASDAPGALPFQGVSSGPWRLETYQAGQGARLVPNPRHPRAADRKAAAIRLRFVQAETSGDDLFRAGDADLVFGMIPIERIRALRAAGAPELVTMPVACTYFLALRVDRPPLSDLRVRRALSAAVDRERLVLQVIGMGQEPLTGIVPTALWRAHGQQPPVEAAYDPTVARAALGDARPAEALPYLLNEGAGNLLIAQAVQRDVAEALGVTLELTTLEWGTLLARVNQGDFAIARMTWCAASPDPAEFVRSFGSKSPDNVFGFADPAVDEAIAALDRAGDLPTRLQAVRAIEARVLEGTPVVPLYSFARALLVRPCLKGLHPNPFDVQRWETLDASACR